VQCFYQAQTQANNNLIRRWSNKYELYFHKTNPAKKRQLPRVQGQLLKAYKTFKKIRQAREAALD